MRYNSHDDRAARAVAQWRVERPDLDASPMALFGRLTEAAQLVSQGELRPFLAGHGLQYGEFDVLATLRRAPPPHALSPTALYAATMVTSGAMTGRVDRLETAGLVERRAHATDRRGTCVALTTAGFDLIDRVITLHVANYQRLLGGLTRAEQEALAGLLGKLIATLPLQRERSP